MGGRDDYAEALSFISDRALVYHSYKLSLYKAYTSVIGVLYECYTQLIEMTGIQIILAGSFRRSCAIE